MPKISEINDKSEEFMAAVHKFLARPFGFFLIAGTNGNGKSFTARAIFESFYDPLQNNLFWNQYHLSQRWLKEVNEFNDTSYLLGEILKAPLLVLDDIGTRKPTDAFMDFLYWIADQRFENRAKYGTIITTNLNTDTMRDMMGDAFMSRVSSGICIRNDKPDRRKE